MPANGTRTTTGEKMSGGQIQIGQVGGGHDHLKVVAVRVPLDCSAGARFHTARVTRQFTVPAWRQHILAQALIAKPLVRTGMLEKQTSC